MTGCVRFAQVQAKGKNVDLNDDFDEVLTFLESKE